MENVVDSAMNRIEEDKVKGIFFDGKKDKTTKILRFNEDTKHYHSEIVEEEHYTVTWEPAGKYLFHYTPEPADADEKAAKKIANPIYDWLLVRNLLGDLVMRFDFNHHWCSWWSDSAYRKTSWPQMSLECVYDTHQRIAIKTFSYHHRWKIHTKTRMDRSNRQTFGEGKHIGN